MERLNTFLKKNGLAEIALLQSYYDYEEREKVLEQTMHQFEKKFSEIGVRESSKLSENQKGEVAAMTASFFGKKDGLKLLNSTPVSVLKYYFKEKIEQEQDFAVTTESVNSETIFNALEQNFQKLGDIPFSTAKQAEFFQKNGCNAAETYQAVKALKSQKSITDKISPTDILLPYPNNLLLELGITVSSQPVSAEFTSNLMQMIDETLKMQKTSLSELLEMRYEKNLPFEKIAKATKMPSVTASLPKKIQILKENKTFMQNAVEMYEAELNPEKVFSRKEEEIPSKPLPSKHTIAEQHFKSPVPKSDNPPVPEYPNNLLQTIGIDSEKPLSREFEKNLWEIIQKTNIPDRNMDILMQYYHDGRTQAELTKDFSISRERIRQIVLGTPRKIAKLKGTIIKNLYDKECMGELEYQRPDYPNNFLEAVGFGKINGKISEGFQSMLEDVMFNADNTREKRANEILKDFYKHDFTKAEIAEKYDISEATVQTDIVRMQRLLPIKEVSELLLDELKSNDNIAMSEDSSLIVLLHMEKADPVLATIHDALSINKLITFGDVLQSGMEQVQKTFSEAGFTAGEFAKFTEIMTDFCNQNPEEWKYRTPEQKTAVKE